MSIDHQPTSRVLGGVIAASAGIPLSGRVRQKRSDLPDGADTQEVRFGFPPKSDGGVAHSVSYFGRVIPATDPPMFWIESYRICTM